MVDGTTVKNRPTLVKTKPVVQLAWLGLGGGRKLCVARGGRRGREDDVRGREERERARAREKEGERQRERERERECFFSFGVQ